ncbi:MAG: hypothetical protein ACM3PB_00550 [Betaproteobacteria bacterium]
MTTFINAIDMNFSMALRKFLAQASADGILAEGAEERRERGDRPY